ncbi:uncharacterized protein LOC133723269 [Rosa rugosa]|uniref:uncharacterized protein LOC133723269 n=1 Tax=Rosa rugosa TaxID=74645 RepID=UPI002B402B37|nr:uncharacterized protein LOC133723269 [Rosa rugosa]
MVQSRRHGGTWVWRPTYLARVGLPRVESSFPLFLSLNSLGPDFFLISQLNPRHHRTPPINSGDTKTGTQEDRNSQQLSISLSIGKRLKKSRLQRLKNSRLAWKRLTDLGQRSTLAEASNLSGSTLRDEGDGCIFARCVGWQDQLSCWGLIEWSRDWLFAVQIKRNPLHHHLWISLFRFLVNSFMAVLKSTEDNDQVQEFPQQSHQNLRVQLKQRNRFSSLQGALAEITSISFETEEGCSFLFLFFTSFACVGGYWLMGCSFILFVIWKRLQWP